MRRAWLILAALLPAPAAHACNVPVFRYALEKWKPDLYQVYVFHEGPLTKEQTALVKTLGKHGPGEDVASNMELNVVDLDKDDEAKKLYTKLGKPALPCLAVQATNLDREVVTIWSGKLEEKAVQSLVQSPMRKELAKRLQAGETAVWLLLESGDKKQDDAAAALLEKELKRVAPKLKLPKLTADPADKLAENGPPLKLAFSVLRIKRDDPAEEMLRTMLLKSEEDIEKRKEPMAFPIFGRGRTLGGLIGAGLTGQNLEEGCGFLVQACSCKVKVQSPGFDLLLSTDWDAIFAPKK